MHRPHLLSPRLLNIALPTFKQYVCNMHLRQHYARLKSAVSLNVFVFLCSLLQCHYMLSSDRMLSGDRPRRNALLGSNNHRTTPPRCRPTTPCPTPMPTTSTDQASLAPWFSSSSPARTQQPPVAVPLSELRTVPLSPPTLGAARFSPHPPQSSLKKREASSAPHRFVFFPTATGYPPEEEGEENKHAVRITLAQAEGLAAIDQACEREKERQERKKKSASCCGLLALCCARSNRE